MKKRLRFVITVILIILGTGAVAEGETTEKKRTFLFYFGAGGAFVFYGTEVDNMQMLTSPGLDHVTVYMDIAFGWAVQSNTYILLTANGVADYGDWFFGDIQKNTYLYGVSWYPFTTGLVLGAEAGGARMVTFYGNAQMVRSPWGYGLGVAIAYDFARKPTGFSLVLGLKPAYSVIGSDRVCL